MSKPIPTKPTKPAQPIVKIRLLTRTSCETVEGQQIQADKGAEIEVPKRAADHLIAHKQAELV